MTTDYGHISINDSNNTTTTITCRAPLPNRRLA